MQTKTCPECGFKIIGRSDKVFCSDQCRNTHNNKLTRDANNYVRRINNTLRKNRRVLLELNPSGKTKVRRNDLLDKGFNFDFYTNTYKTKTGKTYYFCYEYGYLPVEDDFVVLVFKQEYVDK